MRANIYPLNIEVVDSMFTSGKISRLAFNKNKWFRPRKHTKGTDLIRFVRCRIDHRDGRPVIRYRLCHDVGGTGRHSVFKALNAVMGTGMAALGLVLLYDTIPTIISLLSLNTGWPDTGWPGISVTSQGNYNGGI